MASNQIFEPEFPDLKLDIDRWENLRVSYFYENTLGTYMDCDFDKIESLYKTFFDSQTLEPLPNTEEKWGAAFLKNTTTHHVRCDKCNQYVTAKTTYTVKNWLLMGLRPIKLGISDYGNPYDPTIIELGWKFTSRLELDAGFSPILGRVDDVANIE